MGTRWVVQVQEAQRRDERRDPQNRAAAATPKQHERKHSGPRSQEESQGPIEAPKAHRKAAEAPKNQPPSPQEILEVAWSLCTPEIFVIGDACKAIYKDMPFDVLNLQN